MKLPPPSDHPLDVSTGRYGVPTLESIKALFDGNIDWDVIDSATITAAGASYVMDSVPEGYVRLVKRIVAADTSAAAGAISICDVYRVLPNGSYAYLGTAQSAEVVGGASVTRAVVMVEREVLKSGETIDLEATNQLDGTILYKDVKL